jgi:hypothetical protein
VEYSILISKEGVYLEALDDVIMLLCFLIGWSLSSTEKQTKKTKSVTPPRRENVT